MFDLPSMLGEYLLPLLIVVPLAVVVLIIAARASKDEPGQRSAPPPWMPPASKPREPAGAAADRPSAPSGAPQGVSATPFVESLEHTLPDARAVLPAPAPVAPPAPLTPAQAPAVEAPIPLLVVDDSAVVRAKLSKLLAGAGYAVTLARHGHEALEQLNQHWFAVMITDLEMPEMDGFELIAQVSNDLRTENLPIVAITGHEALQAKVQDAKGLFGIFKKPWNDRELLARVAVLAQLRSR